ncbi:MAG: hypothetical protein O3A76_05845 [Chloroflexi bacterium]|nr:hypothetical protein [Chloroflexota bacterium]
MIAQAPPHGSVEGGTVGVAIGVGLRRGIFMTPIGALLGAALGLASGGTETLDAGEAALVMATLFGFGLAPALASAVVAARRLNRGGRSIGPGLAIGTLLPAVVGAAWMALGAAGTFAVGSLIELDVQLGALLILGAALGFGGGAVIGLLVTAILRATRRTSDAPAQ